MAETREETFNSSQDLPPGTFRLIQSDQSSSHRQNLVLEPIPSNDPNDPLNWSIYRKALNFGIVLCMTAVIFTTVSIQSIFWPKMSVDLNTTYAQLNHTKSVNFVGFSVGCIFFIPMAKKYGRRPVYIASTALLLATSFWLARMTTIVELYTCNLLQGLGGATNEAIAEITIADLFFVHRRAKMNGLYILITMAGYSLSPMAAGAQAVHDGWRSSYLTLGIFNAVVFLLFVFLFEETKFIPRQEPFAAWTNTRKDNPPNQSTLSMVPNESSKDTSTYNRLRRRFAIATPTPEPIWPYIYRPFVLLFNFPAVIYTALQYACGVACLIMISLSTSLVFPRPPYSFNPTQVGYMSIAPFIGNLLGCLYGGVLGDWSVVYFSRKRNGYFEPEMRLYLQHIPALAMTGGLIMFGVTVSKGMHWIYPSIAGILFGFGLASMNDAALTLLVDSYREITGDAFTAVTLVRNVVSIGVPFAIIPWINTDGIQDMFIVCGFISLGVTSLSIPMIIWGKRFRQATFMRYQEMATS